MSENWYVHVGENVGLVLSWFAAVMASLVVASLVWGEYYAIPGTLVSVAIVFGVGKVLMWRCNTADDYSQAMVFASAAVVWFVAALAGMLPFLAIAWTVAIDPAFLTIPASAHDATLRAFLSPINAWFESMSGITGSGLTMTRYESDLPATLQWWRSVMQWLGGIGVIVLVITFINQSGDNALQHYYGERTPLGQFQSDTVSNSPQLLTSVFTGVTLLAIALLWIAGMPAWEAINHAMTGLATGGFTVTDRSIASYESLTIRMALIPVMIVGAVPLLVYYFLFKGRFQDFYTDIQVQWLLVISGLGSLVVAGNLFAYAKYPSLFETAHYAVFQFVSAITCTGFYTQSSLGQNWPGLSLLVLTIAMGVGGASGSTASGVKIIRMVSIVRALRGRLRDPFPEGTFSESLDESVSGQHSSANYHNASIIVFLWVGFYLLGVFVLLVVLSIGPGAVPVKNVLFEVASAQGNVGLTSGITTPSTPSKPLLPASAKVMLTLNMWVGRLEIIPVLVFFRVLFWEAENE